MRHVAQEQSSSPISFLARYNQTGEYNCMVLRKILNRPRALDKTKRDRKDRRRLPSCMDETGDRAESLRLNQN
jgi:hypothetical protein